MNKLVSAVIVAAALAAGPIQAAGAAGNSTTVHTADLNLGTASGMATFRGRVKAAANRVCGVERSAPFEEAAAIGQCRAQVFHSAEAQLALALAARSNDSVAGTR